MADVVNLTKQKIPKIKWQALASRVLGDKFDLSVVLVGEVRMSGIKKKYPPLGTCSKSGAGKATNVLSFLVSDNVGEIFLCPEYIKREAHLFSRSFNEHMLTLYIHGLLHLKGFDHKTKKETLKMQKEEQKVIKWLRT